ncbi:MAG: autotransporter domain-containing protein [Alphaproteobacteria bacterium]
MRRQIFAAVAIAAAASTLSVTSASALSAAEPCDGTPVTFTGDSPSFVTNVAFDMKAGDSIKFALSIKGSGSSNPQFSITAAAPGEKSQTVCSSQNDCNSATFTANVDGVFQLQGSTKSGGNDNSLTYTCGVAAGFSADQTVDLVDKVLKQAGRIMTMDAATLANAALNGSLGLTTGLTDVSPSNQDDAAGRLRLMGHVGQDEFAIGFEQSLSAAANNTAGMGDEDGDVIVGNARYYDFNGVLDGDALQGQIGFRHGLANDRTVTVFGSFRQTDVDASDFGLSLEEESYGAGLILQGPVGEKLKGVATVHYETGDADIRINNATGSTDVDRFSAALALKGTHETDTLTLSPRIVAGIVAFSRDRYTDSAALVIDGDEETEHFVEVGVRVVPQTVAPDGLNWFVDASADYASETLDGVQTLSGRRIDDSDFAGNAEAGLTFSLEKGAKLIVSGGGRGLGRESRAIFGNALVTVPLN